MIAVSVLVHDYGLCLSVFALLGDVTYAYITIPPVRSAEKIELAWLEDEWEIQLPLIFLEDHGHALPVMFVTFQHGAVVSACTLAILPNQELGNIGIHIIHGIVYSPRISTKGGLVD